MSGVWTYERGRVRPALDFIGHLIGHFVAVALNPRFSHEDLQVYGKALSHRLARQIDEAATCVVLNIAEGNGRFSVLDHHRFLQIANRASVKAAVYLDLAVEKGLVDGARGRHRKGTPAARQRNAWGILKWSIKCAIKCAIKLPGMADVGCLPCRICDRRLRAP